MSKGGNDFFGGGGDARIVYNTEICRFDKLIESAIKIFRGGLSYQIETITSCLKDDIRIEIGILLCSFFTRMIKRYL